MKGNLRLKQLRLNYVNNEKDNLVTTVMKGILRLKQLRLNYVNNQKNKQQNNT